MAATLAPGAARAAPSARPTPARALKPRASSSGNAHARLGRVDVRARATSTTDASQASVTAAKRALYDAMEGTYRGAGASASERAAVEEAQVALETLDVAGAADIDLELLSGKWRLVYTTAADVLSVLRIQRDLGPLSPVEVGDIFQSFTADGRIENEIRLSVPLLLAPATMGTAGGVALKVDADYAKCGARTLSLTFQEARVTEVRISDLAEAFIAPALLPRGSINHQILLAIKELELRFPLRGAVTAMGGPATGRPARGDDDGGGSRARSGGAAVGAYLLSYLDETTLIGRASGSGGTFVFERASGGPQRS